MKIDVLENNLVLFSKVVNCPQRLQVCIMETPSLLTRFRQIERRARTYVVDMNFRPSCPIHSWLKFRLNMFNQLVYRTSDKISSVRTLYSAVKSNGLKKRRSQSALDSIANIVFISTIFSFSTASLIYWIGTILSHSFFNISRVFFGPSLFEQQMGGFIFGNPGPVCFSLFIDILFIIGGAIGFYFFFIPGFPFARPLQFQLIVDRIFQPFLFIGDSLFSVSPRPVSRNFPSSTFRHESHYFIMNGHRQNKEIGV